MKDFDIDCRGGIRKFGRLVVPNISDLRKDILEDSHRSKFTIHPGSSKMYADMKRLYYWEGMKSDITNFVKCCMTCQLIKDEHQPGGLLQPLEIPIWKWDQISMDFIDGLLRSHSGHDSLWVIVDNLLNPPILFSFGLIELFLFWPSSLLKKSLNYMEFLLLVLVILIHCLLVDFGRVFEKLWE